MNWNEIIVVRGGGDIATGIIHKLVRSGFKLIVLETAMPTAIRRKVSFCEAVYDGVAQVEGISCVKVDTYEEALEVIQKGNVPLMIDVAGTCIQEIKPLAVIDAIIAKKNLGTNRQMAPITIALGPGFEAGVDVDFVIETSRGHQLGKIIERGKAKPNTGIPGLINGYGEERVIHAPVEGRLHGIKEISDVVKEGELIAQVDEHPIYATLTGVLRGMIREGYQVKKGLKIIDIDPRESEKNNCFTISDKARCVAGSVLEAILIGYWRMNGR
ncbi:MAG: selenium-dependent molybdenum cofactor biosynthesis protein YqeB [Niameybacter sp.]|uniref:selenium-dependent molybdenum cofactor biosynthesis protein YqeB n=1 Tax=Niameybacter sp. TaxID=2033640 RepID=UPI002FC7F640